MRRITAADDLPYALLDMVANYPEGGHGDELRTYIEALSDAGANSKQASLARTPGIPSQYPEG